MMFWHTLGISALWIVGFHVCFHQEMIFEKLGDWLEDRLGEYVCKPIFGCPICMASLHGSVLWFYLDGDPWIWPVFVVALAGLMKIWLDNLTS